MNTVLGTATAARVRQRTEAVAAAATGERYETLRGVAGELGRAAGSLCSPDADPVDAIISAITCVGDFESYRLASDIDADVKTVMDEASADLCELVGACVYAANGGRR